MEESSSPALLSLSSPPLTVYTSKARSEEFGEFTEISSVVLTIVFSREPEDFRVSFGDHQVLSSGSPWDRNEVRMDIEEFIVHPGYTL